MRHAVVNWFAKVSASYEFANETVLAALNHFDRCVSVSSVPLTVFFVFVSIPTDSRQSLDPLSTYEYVLVYGYKYSRLCSYSSCLLYTSPSPRD